MSETEEQYIDCDDCEALGPTGLCPRCSAPPAQSDGSNIVMAEGARPEAFRRFYDNPDLNWLTSD